MPLALQRALRVGLQSGLANQRAGTILKKGTWNIAHTQVFCIHLRAPLYCDSRYFPNHTVDGSLHLKGIFLEKKNTN